ncbi:MAG: hypothetical protein GY738_25225 [Pseudoalteromonas sp.]|nr:hypothetical protein [Pseudoalteromonas sp.]
MNVELLRKLSIEPSQDNCFLFYPTLSSLLSQCLLDLDVRSKVVSYYETMSNELFELKKKNRNSLTCIGISIVGNKEFNTALNGIAYKTTYSNKNSSLEGMLAEFFIHKNKKLKKTVGSLSAISQFVEEIHISASDMQSELEFVQDSLFIKSSFGKSSDIASSIDLLHEKSEHIEQLKQNYEELKTQNLNVTAELEAHVAKQESLKKDCERAIHQIQVLQESLVEKHQEISIKESEFENTYSKQLAELNKENGELLAALKVAETEKISVQESLENSIKENDELLAALKVAETEKISAQELLENSIKEIQNLQELYEVKSIDTNRFATLNSELEKENRVLATKILDVNKEQMDLSLLYSSATEQAERDRKQAIAKQKVLERELTRFKTRNAEITHKYSSLRYKIFCINRELELIQSSPFWKGSRLLKNLKSKLNKNKISESVKSDIALIATSEFFDFDWYLETYSDVQEANVDPAQHYLIAGAQEGRLPGPNFDGNWYLERYPDVAEAEINPLLHFIKCGKREGRVPSPKMLADKRKV